MLGATPLSVIRYHLFPLTCLYTVHYDAMIIEYSAHELSKKIVTKASKHAKAEHNSNVCVLSAVEVCSCQAQRQTCGMCLHYVQRGQLVMRDSVTSTKQQSENLSA